ncbi:MAG TPA: alpha/beta hydrolase [Steroidobacteraceae bacterium]
MSFRKLPFVALLAIACATTPPAWGADCRIGLYQLANQDFVDIAPAGDSKLRWRRPDGTSGALSENTDGSWSSTLGWTGKPDGRRISFTSCDAGGIEFDGIAGRRAALETRELKFESAGATLAGRLVMPAGKSKVPLVVLVHGSEQMSALEFYALQRLFPSAGIGVFVYDKRGTGASTGTFTHDYHALAADAAEAVRTARKLAGARAKRVGFQGSSQGGWVAPLAATLTPVDFIVVGYGLAVSPFDEDNEAVALDMTRHGFGEAETARALEVAHAAQAIVLNGFQSGYEELDAVRARYAHEPWLKFVRGNVTQVILSQPRDVLREHGPVLFAGILPHYDPMPVLRRLDTPQLWILAADDIDAPVAETVRRLRSLSKEGRPITTVIYPRTEHGLYEFEVDAAGERLSTRQPGSYLPLMVDFIRRGNIRARYGDSTIYR